MDKDKVIKVCKDALKCIARLTPFPISTEDTILSKAINETADYADEIRKELRELIKELEDVV